MVSPTLGEERTAKAVFEDHLRISKEGSIEQDLARNYAQDLVVLTRHGVFHGYEGLRYLADVLRRELPNCTYEYTAQLVENDVAMSRSSNGRLAPMARVSTMARIAS